MDFKRNIAIIGANKSINYEVAKLLADRLEMYFLDSDEYIEYEADIPPALLIGDYGADFFYRLESDKLARLETFDNSVISTSATALMNEENINKLSEFCYLVLLNAERDTIVERLKRDKNALLVGDVIKRKAQLFMNINAAARSLAEIEVSTDAGSPLDICEEVMEKLEKLFG